MQKLFITTLAILLSLITFEFYLKFSPFSYGVSPVRYDSKIGMWHKEDFTGKIVSECYKTVYAFDSHGRIVNTYSHNPSKQDIILLGDSYLEALMVQNQNILHNQLSAIYDHQYNFLNYGLSGSSPVQQFVILKEKINLENTKVVLQFINIDSDLYDVDPKKLDTIARPKVFMDARDKNHYTIIYPRKKTFRDTAQDFLGNFELYVFTKKLLYTIKEKILNNKQVIPQKSIKISQNLSKNWLILETAIIQTATHIKQQPHNISYVIILNPKDPKNLTRIQKFLNRENIKFIVMDKTKVSLTGFSCDDHWNDITHQHIAKFLYNQSLINE